MLPPIVEVWNHWVAFVAQHISKDQVGCLVAWNGKSCECQRLYKIIHESHHGILVIPSSILYMMDPYHMLESYTKCELNKKNRGVGALGHGLAEVYCYVTGTTTLEGAQDANKYAGTQVTICSDDCFCCYMDKMKAIVLFEDIWKAKRKLLVCLDFQRFM